jgi:hypothetical protein
MPVPVDGFRIKIGGCEIGGCGVVKLGVVQYLLLGGFMDYYLTSQFPHASAKSQGVWWRLFSASRQTMGLSNPRGLSIR